MKNKALPPFNITTLWLKAERVVDILDAYAYGIELIFLDFYETRKKKAWPATTGHEASKLSYIKLGPSFLKI